MSLSDAMTDLIMQHQKAMKEVHTKMVLSQTIAEIHIGVLRQRIETAKQRLESLNGQHVGQAELYEVIAILEGNSPEIPEGLP